MKNTLFFFIIVLFGFNQAYAVPPPDFIIQVVSNFGIYFALSVAFLSSMFFAIIHHLKMYFSNLSKIKITIMGFVFISTFSFAGSFFYDNYKQDLEIKRIKNEMNISRENIKKINHKREKLNEKTIIFEELETIGDNELQKNRSDGEGNIQESNIVEGIALEGKSRTTHSLTITNKDFEQILNSSNQKFIILDAREDLEVQIGKMPGSTHIRFADLKNEEYKKLNKYISTYVYCWSGIRGKKVALYLKSKGIKAISLKDGAKGWVEYGGRWKGEIKFSNIFNKKEYKKLFMKDTLQEAVEKGVVLIDVRKTIKYKVNALKGSISLPLVELPKNKWDSYIKKIPKNSHIITVCDDYVNCFYAKIVGIELEKRGHIFKGRYSLAYN